MLYNRAPQIVVTVSFLNDVKLGGPCIITPTKLLTPDIKDNITPAVSHCAETICGIALTLSILLMISYEIWG